MKTRLYQIAMIMLPFIASCLVMYLIGSFVAASFAPIDWAIGARVVFSVWGFVFGFALWMKLEAGNVH